MAARLKSCGANSWLQIFCGFVVLEIVSFAVFPYFWLSRLAFIAALLIAGYFTWQKLENGVYFLLAELIVGGLGALLMFPIGGGHISIRLGLFAVVFAIWLIRQIQSRDFNWLKDKRLIPLCVFAALFLLAIGQGYLSGHSLSAIYSDMNGYLYLALIPLFLSIKLDPKMLARILVCGSLVLGLKTIAILFIFSHGFAFVGANAIYKWIRDTGVGEITLISSPLYRVFFQSHFYNLLALILSACLLLIRPRELEKYLSQRYAQSLLILFAWFNFFIIVISQSRSFWVGGLAVLIIMIPAAAIYYKIDWRRIVIYFAMIPVFALLSNFAGQAVIGDFQTDFFTGRVSGASGEAAVSSRMAELAPAFELIKNAPLLGNGFGTTVHFRSDDPRIKNNANPEGWTDAAMIEWGYLDLAIKAGILGLLAYLVFLAVIFWQLFVSSLRYDYLSAGLLAGFAALLIVHMFTPYLNHPLGLGLVLALWSLTNGDEK